MAVALHRGVVAILAAAAVLAACTEEAQLLVPTGEQTLETKDRERQLRERTLNQGESERIAY